MELRTNTTQSDGICRTISVGEPRVPPQCALTISPSRARAESKVCGASLCLSISSSTNTNFPRLSVVLAARHSSRSTASELTCSHRPLPNFSHSSLCPRASRVFQSILVRRCRPVMHSVLRTTACGTASAERTPRIIVDLQVAEMPCTTTVGGPGICGYLRTQID